MKRLVLAAALLCTAGSFAQSRGDESGYRTDDEEYDYAPETGSDTTLFYNTVKQADDLYARMAGYRLAFVQNRRRNADYWQRRTIFAGLSLAARNSRTLRALGAECATLPTADARTAVYGAEAGADECVFAPAYAGRASSAGVTFADKGYNAGVRASVAAALGRGWSVDAAIDARTGRDLHVDGVFTNAAGAALRVAKRFAGGGELSLTLAAGPSERGLRSASTDEAYALTGDNLYNPSWGWQNGRQRNARVRREMLPLAVATYSTAVGRMTSLTAAVAAEAGRVGQSALGWYDAATPMPDNYRCMPSFLTNDPSADEVAGAWRRGDARYTQIDWEELYAENRMADRGAVYALEERVRQITGLQAALSFRTDVNDRLTFGYGARARYDAERNYRRMRDLLGAPYLIDIDYYLIDDDSYSDARQNDLRNPDRAVVEGDRFGYDYALRHRSAELWATADYASGRFDMSVAARLGSEWVGRYGFFEKELFPGNGSYGASDRMQFATYAAAATFGWSFSPRYRLYAALRASAEAPDAADLFLNPQYNNRTVGRTATERRSGAELGFRMAGRRVQLQAALFAQSQRDGMATQRYYDDLAGEFCDMTADGIDIAAYGAEAAATVRIARCWYAEAVATAMQCRYTSNPTVMVWTDRSNEVVDAGSPAHMGDCIPGGVPRLAAAATVGYRSANGWQAALSAAWVGARRVEAAMVRRTERVAYQGASSPEAFEAITAQESLPDAFDVGLRVSKRWYAGRSSRITLSLTVDNLTGERGNVWSAYESPRVRRISRGVQVDYTPLPTRRLYALPRSATVALRYDF